MKYNNNNNNYITSNLKHIWEQITPEEIKNNPVISTSMEIFCELLTTHSKISLDISNVFEDEYFIREYFNTYNGALQSTIEQLKTDKQFFNAIYSGGNVSNGLINIDLINAPHTFFDKTDLILFREIFKKWGTIESIKYVYDWIGKYTGEELPDLIVKTIEPFVMEVEGTLDAVLYEKFVKVLQHPLGFQISYAKYILVKFGKEYFYNKDNMFQITKELIDDNGLYNDIFWKHNGNPNLKQFTSLDFPEFDTVLRPFSKTFYSLHISMRTIGSSVWNTYDFLNEIDSNLDYTGNTLSVLYEEHSEPYPGLSQEIYYLTNNKKLIIVKNSQNIINKNKIFYYDGQNLLFSRGENEVITLDFQLDGSNEVQIDEGTSSVLDYLRIFENLVFQDEFEIKISELPPELQDDLDFLQPKNDYRHSAFDKQIHFIDFEYLDGVHKPLLFDFLPTGTNVQKTTPYNNDVYNENAGTLAENSYKSYENWDNQYFDWNKPLRKTENYDKVFQQYDQNQKWFFSQLDYEPWQLFDSINSKPNYGYWTKEEHSFKFIGQDSGRPIQIGDNGITVNRGVRSTMEMPGYEKKSINTSSPFYAQSQANLENRKYWQPLAGTDNIQQYDNYKLALRSGELEEQFFGGRSYLNVGETTAQQYTLRVNTDSGFIGQTDKTAVSVTGDAVFIEYKTDQETLQTHLYIDGETLYGQDNTSRVIYWFEHPKRRINPINGGEESTFYRQISPRQEEHNYMYFTAIRSNDQDPVNLQYRTLESFEIEQIPVP